MVLKISTTDTLIYDLHKIALIFMQFIKSHFMICINYNRYYHIVFSNFSRFDFAFRNILYLCDTKNIIVT